MRNIATFTPKGEKPTQEEIDECKSRQKKYDEEYARERKDNIRSGIIVVSLIVLGGIYFGHWKWSDFDVSFNFNLIEILLFIVGIAVFLIIGEYLSKKFENWLSR